MSLITNEHHKLMLRNGRFNTYRREQGAFEIDFKPVVKLHVPGTSCLWLLAEIDPDNPDTAYGLCDLGSGQPELGYVSLFELSSLRDIARDEAFVAMQSLGAYAEVARLHGRIVA